MEYQEILFLVDNTPNQGTKRRIKKFGIDNGTHITYNTNSQIKCETLMVKSILCNYSDAYILVIGTISIGEQGGDNPNDVDEEVVFKNCTPFTDSIR